MHTATPQPKNTITPCWPTSFPPPDCSLMLFDWHQGRCAGLLLHLTGGSHTQIPGVDSIHRPQTDMYKRNAW